MEYCHHDYHYLVMAVFDDLAKINKVAVKKVMDGVFLDGFEPLVVEVYEELRGYTERGWSLLRLILRLN